MGKMLASDWSPRGCYKILNKTFLPGKKSSMHLAAKSITLKLGPKYFFYMNSFAKFAFLKLSL